MINQASVLRAPRHSALHPKASWSAQSAARVYARKTPLFHQGDTATHFYKVKTGVIMIFRLLEDSQRQITGFCSKGDFFGLSPDEVHHDTAVAVTTSSVVAISIADVRADLALQQEIFQRTCYQLEEAQNMMMTLSKKSAGEKVAAFLVMLAKRQERIERDMDEGIDIPLPMSRLDIADYLGLTIETVSRRLTLLKSEGIIDLPDRRSAHICEYKQLETLAGALA